MIDIHTHIAFGLDDGATNVKESIEIARQAVAEGIHTIVATPHQKHPSFDHELSQFDNCIEVINQSLKELEIPLTILQGQEIRLYGELVDHLPVDTNLLTINNSKYVLVEFPSSSIPKYTDELFFQLLTNEYIPIIAHPERNAEIADNPDKLYRLIKNGALSQVTAGSITGAFGKNLKKLSLQLIEHQLTHFVGSDVHNNSNRNFHWRAAHQVIESKLGSDYVDLLQQNAEYVITNKQIRKRQPEHVAKKKLLGIF